MNAKIEKQLRKAKRASLSLGLLPYAKRKLILKNLAKGLRKSKKAILSANEKDLKKFPKDDPMRDRLLLTPERIEGMAREVEGLTGLPDPIGETFDCRNRNGLSLCRKRVPMGVIGIIYESRPNVTTDVSAICLIAGNAAVLKGGHDGKNSYIALHKVIRQALLSAKADPEAVQFIDPAVKGAAEAIITARGLVDLAIPRGSARLINFVRDSAKIPVIETGAGVCHTFVDESAKLSPSAKIIWNAKTQRPSVCNALDTALVHKKNAEKFLPMMAKLLKEKRVEIFADRPSYGILKKCYPTELLKPAKPENFGREYLSQKMSVKIVSGLDEALSHIAKYSSKHSEAILTENKKNAERFQRETDAAVVYVNASTRFSDGAVFGLGSEIGNSTDKLHARGPMGTREMTTYKWLAEGKYGVRK